MFEKFTDRARKVMAMANEEARRHNHEYIGTEHILLGLVKEGTGVGATVLKRMNVDLRAVYNEVEKFMRPGPDPIAMGKLPHTPQSRIVIESAIATARDMGHRHVGTEHLLLGLLAARQGIARSVLEEKFGVRWKEVRQQVLALVKPGAPDTERTGVADDVPLSSASERILRDAWTEAGKGTGQIVRPEHILLGLLLTREGVAAEILREHGLTCEKVRERMPKGEDAGEDQAAEPAEQAATGEAAGAVASPQGPQPGPNEEPGMFARFTDRGRKVMALANQEAQRFNHERVGPEHMLLGLIKEGTGVGATVLKKMRVDLHKARYEVEKMVKVGPDMVPMGKLPHTPRAKKVIEFARDEASDLHHHYVGTEHLLLGLLREREGIAARVLMNLGLKLEDVRQEVLCLLGGEPGETRSEPRRKSPWWKLWGQ